MKRARAPIPGDPRVRGDSSPSHVVALLAGLLLLVVAWLQRPAAVPLYDGLGLPPEAYRYLHPAQGETGAPSSNRQLANVAHGTWRQQFVSTAERPPQASMILDDGTLLVPPGVTRVVLTVKPVPPPPGTDPHAIDGNVYLFSATTPSGAAVPVNPQKGVFIQLRLTGAHGAAHIEQYVHGAWVLRRQDTYLNTLYLASTVNSLGRFALIFTGRPTALSSGTNWTIPAIAGGIVVLLVVVALAALRRSRTRAPI